MATTDERILAAAKRLFAARGYDGTSVRAICSEAGANVNAVSYHFGGKRGLFNTVMRQLGDRRLASAHRILGAPPCSHDELEMRLVLFAEETLATWLAEPELLIILFAEFNQSFRGCIPETVASLIEQKDVLVRFLRAASEAGLIRQGVNPELIAGGLLERLNNQALYADNINSLYGTTVKDPEYRREWVRQIIDLLLYGAARPKEE